MKEKIKAILFDMDGVLIEAKEWHYEAFNKSLALFGMNISRYDHLVTFDGLPTKEKLKMLTLERNLPENLHIFINEMKQIHTVEMVQQLCHPIFSHLYALSRLKKEGYKIAVCSNSIRSTIELMMEKSGLLPYLDIFISNEEVKKAKPAPDIYLKAMKYFKLKPYECLVLEDNENGIRAAIASQAHLLRVADINDVNYSFITNKIKEIESC